MFICVHTFEGRQALVSIDGGIFFTEEGSATRIHTSGNVLLSESISEIADIISNSGVLVANKSILKVEKGGIDG